MLRTMNTDKVLHHLLEFMFIELEQFRVQVVYFTCCITSSRGAVSFWESVASLSVVYL